MAKYICIIPARLESSRFPNKILTDINGKKMFEVVYNIARKSEIFDEVYVATHNSKVLDLCESRGISSIRTCETHVCGSSRVFEAAKKLESNWDVVVNFQADQPFLPINYLKAVIRGLRRNPIATIAYKDSLEKDENTVKIVLDKNNAGIYFSRFPIPYNIHDNNIVRYCHLGLYAFKRDFVSNYKGNFQSHLALNESLEQLDFIYNGFKIDVEIIENPILEVNIPSDLTKAKKLGLL